MRRQWRGGVDHAGVIVTVYGSAAVTPSGTVQPLATVPVPRKSRLNRGITGFIPVTTFNTGHGPAGTLLHLVAASAASSRVAPVGLAALVPWDGVLEVALAGSAGAGRERALVVADLDEAAEPVAWLVGAGLVAVVAVVRGHDVEPDGQSPASGQRQCPAARLVQGERPAARRCAGSRLAVDQVRDRLDMLERLADLCEEQGRKSEATELRKEAKRSVAATTVTRQKIGRNEPCPCGSGKKFKKCCGA